MSGKVTKIAESDHIFIIFATPIHQKTTEEVVALDGRTKAVTYVDKKTVNTTDHDAAFKQEKSNFSIVIVVDMWLTGFDVPSLTSLYNDKPHKKHLLIQTISRVNRKYKGKQYGMIIDYIGIRSKMREAMKIYGTDRNVDGVIINDKCKVLDKKVKEIIDTKSSYADWLTNQNIRNQLKLDIKICLVQNGYPPQYSPEVFSKVMDQVENFEENSMDG